jgi:hypothetical protein
MNAFHPRLLRFYHWALRLYPARFREAYSQEMLLVFQMQLDDTPNLNLWRALHILWGELQPLPLLLAAAHLRERRNLQMKTGLERWFFQPQGSWKEILLAVLPFLLIGTLPGIFSLSPALRNLPIKIGMPILIFLALILVVLGLIGLAVGLPRWSLLYAGILLTFMSLGSLALMTTFSTLITIPDTWPSLLFNAVLLGVHLILLFLLVAGVIWIGDKLPLTQGFSQQLRDDPSLISFMLYGGAFLIVLFNFEDVSGVDVYLILASLVMALGGWIYLRTERAANRLTVLITATTLATVFALIANLTLVDYSTPPANFGAFSLPMITLFIGLSWLVTLAMIGLPPLIFKPSTTG